MVQYNSSEEVPLTGETICLAQEFQEMLDDLRRRWRGTGTIEIVVNGGNIDGLRLTASRSFGMKKVSGRFGN